MSTNSLASFQDHVVFRGETGADLFREDEVSLRRIEESLALGS